MLVSVLISTYNSARFIRETLGSVLAQTFTDFEIVVVDDGSTDETAAIVASHADPRIRWIPKEHGGIPETYNRAVAEARGELLARLGHDDLMDPHRLELQVAAMRDHPDVGVVHTDAITIDRHDRVIGRWESSNYGPEELTYLFFRVCNNLIDPSTMVRKAVYEEVGTYDLGLQMANDFDFWCRASRTWRFLHLPFPLVRYRRHGGNYSDERNRDEELREVAVILERLATRYRTLRELVPEVDWGAPDAEARARALAHGILVKRGFADLARRLYPEVVPQSGAGLRAGLAGKDAGPTRSGRQRILQVMYGWAESGGGTILPRRIAQELAGRGHEVMVFYAGASELPGQPLYHIVDGREDGVRLRGVFNRPALFGDVYDPDRECEDPTILAIFKKTLDEFRPDAVHFHNLHNLGIALADEVSRRRIRAFFTPHNFWAVCPRLYLLDEGQNVCAGPGDGRRCGACNGRPDLAGAYARRLERMRAALGGVTILAVSQATRELLGQNGFDTERMPVLYSGHWAADRLWEAFGATRKPAVPDGDVVFGFVGGLLPLKGVHVLVAAAQRLRGRFQVRIHGDCLPAYRQQLVALDRRGVVQFCGPYGHDDLPRILAQTHVGVLPSVCAESAPTLAGAECLAGRVPVLGSAIGGIPELVAGGAGELFEAGSVDDLAGRMQAIIDDRRVIAEWQANIQAPVGFGAFVSKLEACYAGRDPVVAGETPALPGGGAAPQVAEPERPGRKRILMVMYGWADSGGGTILPRAIARDLVHRGHEVQVFYAAVKPMPGEPAYHVHRHEEGGVKLCGVFNRPHVFKDEANPAREILDPPILAAFQDVLDDFRPDVVHVHNLHNLGAALLGEIGRRGIPGYFTPHNYWTVCPRLYLLQDDLALCEGPGDGTRCGSCNGQAEIAAAYSARKARIRDLFVQSGLECLAVSGAVRDLLVGNGYPPERVRVLYQGHEQADRLWREVGRDRRPRAPRKPVFSFIGSAVPHKGAHMVVMAAQRLAGDFEVRIYGDCHPVLAQALRNLDKRGVVRFLGEYTFGELPDILRATDVAVIPSLWYDNAPLAVTECLGARVPVLGADMGGIPELFEPGRTGQVFRGRDVEDLALRMQEVVDDPGLIAAWQANIVEPLSFETYLDRLVELYTTPSRAGLCAGQAGRGAGPTRVPDRERPVTVVWEGTQFCYHSLAHVNREVCAQLLERPDLAVRLLPYEAHQFEADGTPKLEKLDRALGRALPRPATVHVRHMWPPRFDSPPSGAWAMIQPWEYGCIPAEWIGPIREAVDEVWVPSEWVRQGYLKAGIPADRVVVVPNGVDTDLCTPEGPKYPLATRKGFKFLFVGGTFGRKGIDVLVHAYAAAFKAQDDVCLVLKASGNGAHYGDSSIAGELERLRATPDAPEIEYLDQDLSDADIAALYRACDAFVLPYRGEGFGMPIAEAMASGLPVVTTGHGAALDFCDETTAYLIPAREVTPDVTWLPPPAVAYTWAEPDVLELARTLREVVAHPDEAHDKALRARARILADYTWARVADRYEARIRELGRRIPRRFAPDFVDPVRFNLDLTPLAFDGLRGTNILARPDWIDPAWLRLLDTYLRAFRPEDDVALILRAEPGTPDAGERVLGAIADLGYDPDFIPDIVLVDQNLPAHGEGGLYTACQAFVDLGHPDHVRQAAACGLPVLTDPTPGALRALVPVLTQPRAA